MRGKAWVVVALSVAVAMLAVSASSSAATFECEVTAPVAVGNVIPEGGVRCQMEVPCSGPCIVTGKAKANGIGLVGARVDIVPSGGSPNHAACGPAANTCVATKATSSGGAALVSCEWTGVVAVSVKVTCTGTATAPPSAPAVSVVTNKDPVAPGENFTYTITVTNTDTLCDLTSVKVVDLVSASHDGIDFSLGSTSPAADDTTDSEATWNDIGPIGPGASKVLQLDVVINSATSSGTMKDQADVTALCDGQSTGAMAVIHAPDVDASP